MIRDDNDQHKEARSASTATETNNTVELRMISDNTGLMVINSKNRIKVQKSVNKIDGLAAWPEFDLLAWE